MNVAIVDYGSGNLHSAAKAFERMAGAPVAVTSDPDTVAASDRIVLPGVGAFGDCWSGLNALSGMVDALEQAVLRGGRPFLGICVGMQLMATRGLEHGSYPGLGWIPGEVVQMEPSDPGLKVPHMGWNELEHLKPHPVLDSQPGGTHMYFVHSFQFQCADPDHVLATAEYGGALAAVVGRDNMVGSQFHPEKSQKAGLAFIEAFLGVESMTAIVETSVAIVGELSGRDLEELCDAAEAAIIEGGGFGWLTPPPRQIQESYWKGVVLVPGRTLFVGRLDGVIAGSAQLFRPTRNNEAQAAACTLKSAFVAPWARGHRIARMLTEAVETTALAEGFGMINLDVRETQEAAIAMYESLGYLLWGTHPLYARLADGAWVPGRYYYKILVGDAPDRPADGEAGA